MGRQLLIMLVQFVAIVWIATVLTNGAAADGDETPAHVFLIFAFAVVYGGTRLLFWLAGLVGKALTFKQRSRQNSRALVTRPDR